MVSLKIIYKREVLKNRYYNLYGAYAPYFFLIQIELLLEKMNFFEIIYI